MKYCIETVNLRKTFYAKPVLKDINLRIKPGGCIGYLGPNGSGKTTTMKILCNLLKPTRGEAYINGINVQENFREALKNIGAIISVPPLYPFFTPRIILKYIGELRGINKADLDDEIKLRLGIVKLLDSIDDKVGKFSTGMKQRLNIAIALLGNPDILILDEPTIGLDPKGMMEFRETINALKKNRTIFISSHLLFEIEQICDEVIMLGNGRIIKHDSLKNIKKMFKSEKIKINLFNGIEADKIRAIESMEYIKSVKLEEDVLYVFFNKDKISTHQIMKNLFDIGVKMNSFIPIRENLEDFYMKTLKKEGKN